MQLRQFRLNGFRALRQADPTDRQVAYVSDL